VELTGGVSADGKSQLKFEQIVEEDAVAGLFPCGAVCRNVQGTDGGGQFRELVLVSEVGGEWIGEAVGAVFDGGARESAHGVHANAIGERVAGEHAGAVIGVFVGREHVDFGSAEFPAGGAAAGTTVKEQSVAELVAVQHPGLIEPQTADEVTIAVQEDSYKAAAALCGAGFAVDNDALDGLKEIRLELWDGFEAGEVVDVGGNMEEQIAGRVDIEVFKQSSALRADAAYVLDGRQQLIGCDECGWGCGSSLGRRFGCG